jgi:hypothetical protein
MKKPTKTATYVFTLVLENVLPTGGREIFRQQTVSFTNKGIALKLYFAILNLLTKGDKNNG